MFKIITSLVDIVILIVIFFSFFRGLKLGIFVVLFELIIISFFIFFSMKIVYLMNASFLEAYSDTKTLRYIIYSIIIITSIAIIRTINGFTFKFLRSIKATSFTKILGGLLMGFTVVMIISLVYQFLTRKGLLGLQVYGQYLYSYLYLKDISVQVFNITQDVVPFTKEFMRQMNVMMELPDNN